MNELRYDEDWDRGRRNAQDEYDATGQVGEYDPSADEEERSEGFIDGWNYAATHDFD